MYLPPEAPSGPHSRVVALQGHPPSQGIPGEAGAALWSKGFVFGWSGRGPLPFVRNTVQWQGALAARELRDALAQGLLRFRVDANGSLALCGNETVSPWVHGVIQGFRGGAQPLDKRWSILAREGWLLGRNLQGHLERGNLQFVLRAS